MLASSLKNVENKRISILFAAGGTGGHLFPAIAIADEIKRLQPGVEILFVGTKKKIESRVVPEKNYALRTIWISGFHRKFHWSNVLFPLKVFVALMQSFFIIQKFKPDVVIGTGAYVAGPVLFVAAVLGVPTVVHESNSYPGVTTRFLSRRATKVFITFETTKKWLRRFDNIELVGNPTRNELGTVPREEAAAFFNLDPKKKTLLVFGGSLGAASINRTITEIVHELIQAGIQLIWQTGEREFDDIVSSKRLPHGAVWIGTFIDKMEYAYAAADLVMCRAGATTLAELTRVGKPAILIPYPHAAANHQIVNARVLVEAGAAEMILDHEVQAQAKEKIMGVILNDETLKRMSHNSLRLGRPEAGREIAQKILQLAAR